MEVCGRRVVDGHWVTQPPKLLGDTTTEVSMTLVCMYTWPHKHIRLSAQPSLRLLGQLKIKYANVLVPQKPFYVLS